MRKYKMFYKNCALVKKSLSAVALLGAVLNTSVFGMEKDNDAEQNNPILLDRMLMNQQDIAYQESVFQDTVKTLVKLQTTFNEQKSLGVLKNLIELNNQISSLEKKIELDSERLSQIGNTNPKIQSKIDANNVALMDLCNQRKDFLCSTELKLLINQMNVELNRIGCVFGDCSAALSKFGMNLNIENSCADLQKLQAEIEQIRRLLPNPEINNAPQGSFSNPFLLLPAELIVSLGKTSGNILNLRQTCNFMSQVSFGKIEKILTLPSNFGINPNDLETLITDDIQILNLYNVSNEGLLNLGLLENSPHPLCASIQWIFEPSSFCSSIVFNRNVSLSSEFSKKAQGKIEFFNHLNLNGEKIEDQQLRVLFGSFTKHRSEGYRLMFPENLPVGSELVSLTKMLCSLKDKGHYRDILVLDPPAPLVSFFNKISADNELKEIVDAVLDSRLCHLDSLIGSINYEGSLWSDIAVKIDRKNAINMFKIIRDFIPEYDNDEKYYWPTSKNQSKFFSPKKIFLPLLKGISPKGRESIIEFEGNFDNLGFKEGLKRSDLFDDIVSGLSRLEKENQFPCLEKILTVLTINHVKEIAKTNAGIFSSSIQKEFQFALKTFQLTFANYNTNDLDSFIHIMKSIGMDINPLEIPSSRERYEELLSMINKFILFSFVNVSNDDHVVRFLVLNQYKNLLRK